MTMTEHDTRFTVLIVDDDASVRDALSLLLSLRGYRTAVFACAEDLLRALEPDAAGCVIADIKMPGMSGLELQQELRRRGIPLPVVVITGHGDISQARAAFKCDAVDFLEKPFDDEQLVNAIEAAAARERERLSAQSSRRRSSEALSALSERERQVMELLARGMANRDVGEELAISPRTVEVHKARIMSKLGVRNIAELVRLADAVEKQ